MNINDLVANYAASFIGSGTALSAASKSSSAVAAASQQFAKVDKRLQADLDTTEAKLSKFGLLKSALASGQVVARGLTDLRSTASAAEVTVAMGNFFNAFNESISAAQDAAAAPGTSGVSQSANRVANGLKRALPSDPASHDAMAKLGLSIQPDGSMGHDLKKFAAALTRDPVGTRAALAAIGKQMDAVVTQELANSGLVGAEITLLTQRNFTLSAQQKAMQALKDSMVSAPSGGFAGFGLSAYKTKYRSF